jgi:hypothetical protein
MAGHLETEVIQQMLSQIREIPGTVHVGRTAIIPAARHVRPKDESIRRVVQLLQSDWLVSVIGYFLNHRPDSPYAKLDSEQKVQDLIYCIARSQVPDLHYEDPQKKTAGALTSTRVDFSSAMANLFIEVKLANSNHTAKKVEAEISEDIVKYGKHRTFSALVFFVYCYEYSFPNPREFERGFTGPCTIGDHHFNTYCIVKP